MVGKKDRKQAAALADQQQQAERTRLLQLITSAFDGVPPPDADHRTLQQAEAWDSYEQRTQRRDLLGPWQDIPRALLLSCPHALPHLDAQCIHHYLPAILCAQLRTDGQRRTSALFVSLRYTLKPETGQLRAYQRSRFRLLIAPQRAAICAFVEHFAYEEATQRAWRRVASAGDDPGWFRRFY